eukprot:135350-Pelagomonas_calceolata.AAC.1
MHLSTGRKLRNALVAHPFCYAEGVQAHEQNWREARPRSHNAHPAGLAGPSSEPEIYLSKELLGGRFRLQRN